MDRGGIEQLCRQAGTSMGPAAVTIEPRFVRDARCCLAGTGIRTAARIDDMAGAGNAMTLREQVRLAVYDGAEEVTIAMSAGHRAR